MPVANSPTHHLMLYAFEVGDFLDSVKLGLQQKNFFPRPNFFKILYKIYTFFSILGLQRKKLFLRPKNSLFSFPKAEVFVIQT